MFAGRGPVGAVTSSQRLDKKGVHYWLLSPALFRESLFLSLCLWKLTYTTLFENGILALLKCFWKVLLYIQHRKWEAMTIFPDMLFTESLESSLSRSMCTSTHNLPLLMLAALIKGEGSVVCSQPLKLCLPWIKLINCKNFYEANWLLGKSQHFILYLICPSALPSVLRALFLRVMGTSWPPGVTVSHVAIGKDPTDVFSSYYLYHYESPYNSGAVVAPLSAVLQSIVWVTHSELWSKKLNVKSRRK